jgi:hypothetical protein
VDWSRCEYDHTRLCCFQIPPSLPPADMLDLDNVPQVTGRFDHKSFKRACLQKNANPHNRGSDQLLPKVRNWRNAAWRRSAEFVKRCSMPALVRCPMSARRRVRAGVGQRLTTAARARWRRRAAVHRAAQLARWPHWEKIGNRGQLRSLTFNERLSSASASSADGGTLPFEMCR